MKVLGISFYKIDLERKEDSFKNIKISTKLNILGIQKSSSTLLTDSESLIKIKFEYELNYEQDIALLKFSGYLLVSLSHSESDEILNKWEEKKIPEKFKEIIFNSIFRKCNLKALQFEEELNLPPHLPLPSFKIKGK